MLSGVNWARRVTVLLLLLLGGCASKGPINTAEFDNRFAGVVSNAENIVLYSATEVRVGTYMEAEIKMVDSYQGVMVLTNYAVRFLYWDAESTDYRVMIEVLYQDLRQLKYGFNTLIPSFVAIRANNGESFAFMLDDGVVKLTYRFLVMGRAGHLSVAD